MFKPVTPAYKKILLDRGKVIFRQKESLAARFEAYIIYQDLENNSELILAKCRVTFSDNSLYLESIKFSNTIIACVKSHQLMYLEMIADASEHYAELLKKSILVITTDIPLFEEIVLTNNYQLRVPQNTNLSCKFAAVKHFK